VAGEALSCNFATNFHNGPRLWFRITGLIWPQNLCIMTLYLLYRHS
jgi:hypothetical protein